MTVQQRISGEAYPLKLTAQEFLAVADAGLFENFARTELIEGEIWTVNAVHQWHARTMSVLNVEIALVLRQLGSSLEIWSAGSVLATADSVPEPDLAVVRRGQDLDGPIALDAVQLAIEISDSTLRMDLGRKAKLYAIWGIPEYWVVDRDKQQILQHSEPSDNGYGNIVARSFGDPIVSVTLPGLIVETVSLKD